MDPSPLMRLPPELHEQILSYVLPLKSQTLSDAFNSNGLTLDRWLHHKVCKFLASNPILSTCHTFREDGLRLYLRRTTLTREHLLRPEISLRGPDIVDVSCDISTVKGRTKWLRAVKAKTRDDYLHLDKGSESWFTNPSHIIALYKSAAQATKSLVQDRETHELSHRQTYYTHIYRLQAYTDGNALKPIKRALRHTWKRDTIRIDIDPSHRAPSLHNLQKALALLTTEQAEKVTAINNETKKATDPTNSPSTTDTHPFTASMIQDFLDEMQQRFSNWISRVEKFHLGLIEVVEVAYWKDLDDAWLCLDSVDDDIKLRDNLKGDTVVDLVLGKFRGLRDKEVRDEG